MANGKALLGCRVPVIVVSPWTVGNPFNPVVNNTVFDHTSVLKLIESVFNVPPLAARETSSDVGNLLSLIDLNKPPRPAPGIPMANYVFPQKVCASSLTPGIGASGSAFQDLLDSGLLTGWPIHP